MTKKMPDEWRRSVVVPIYKDKGYIKNCTNYQLSRDYTYESYCHTMKLWVSNGAKT